MERKEKLLSIGCGMPLRTVIENSNCDLPTSGFNGWWAITSIVSIHLISDDNNDNNIKCRTKYVAFLTHEDSVRLIKFNAFPKFVSADVLLDFVTQLEYQLSETGWEKRDDTWLKTQQTMRFDVTRQDNDFMLSIIIRTN